MNQVPFLAGCMINSVAGETVDVKDLGKVRQRSDLVPRHGA